MKKLLYFAFLVLVAFGCNDDSQNLPSVEERTSEAINSLKDALTSPANGWKTYYQPTSESGSFYMLLDFDKDGTVRIMSDLPAEDGTYYDQTIPYRIDAGQGLELIFETYGVFHYLFELDQASFGAEFEFIYEEEDGNNLIFISKSDLYDISSITLQPASASDAASLSIEIVEDFGAYEGNAPQLFGGVAPTQQLYLASSDLSVFWTVDLNKRIAWFDIAGIGESIEEVLASGYQTINQYRGFTFQDGKIIFNEPVNINTGNQTLSLSEVQLGDFSTSGDPLCPGGESTPVFQISVAGKGTGTLSRNMFNSTGLGFTPQPEGFYSVNALYVLNDSLQSLQQEGSIAEKLPKASGFMMTYEFVNDTIPANSVGFIVSNDDGYSELYLREIDISQTGNEVKIALKDSYYYTNNPTAAEMQAMEDITNEIFEGGTVYAYDLPIQGITVFQFYNPCNGYEFLLVQ